MEHKMENYNLLQKNEMIEFDLENIFETLREHLIHLVLAALICGTLAYVCTMLFITPQYRSSFSAYVNNRNTSETVSTINSSDVSASQSITKTYSSILTSRSIVNAAISAAGISEDEYSFETIKDSIATSVDESSQLLNVSVTMDDPQIAYSLAAALSKSAPEYAAEIVEGTSMKVLDEPVLAQQPHSPNKKKNSLLGAIAGTFITALILVVRSHLDKSIKSEEGLEKKFGVLVIGSIPDFETAEDNRYSRYGYY